MYFYYEISTFHDLLFLFHFKNLNNTPFNYLIIKHLMYIYNQKTQLIDCCEKTESHT